MKYYAVEMGNGDVYGVDPEVIADNYAKIYESRGEDYQSNFDDMMNWFETDDYEFADWAKNNMSWSDVENNAVLIERKVKKCDFQDGWVNGEYKYIK